MNSPYAMDSPTLDLVIQYSPWTVTPYTLLKDVIALMNRVISVDGSLSDAILPQQDSCVLIVEGTRLVGIFTLRDVGYFTASGRNLSGVRIAEVMTKPVISLTLAESQNALTALLFMRQHQIRHLPVVDGKGELIGLITEDRIRQVVEPAHLLKFLTVAEVMVTTVVHAPPTASVWELAQLMSVGVPPTVGDRHISCVVIVAKQSQREKSNPLLPVGIVTERDIVNFQLQGLDIAQTPAEAVMSQPVYSVSPTASLWTVQQLMQAQGVRRVVVVGEQGELQGLVTQTNLLQIFDPSQILGVMQVLQEQVQEQTAQLKEANQKLQQEVIQRQQLETSLQQAQAELELRVAERTAELVQANTRLQREIAERKQLQTALQLNQFCLDRAIDVVAYIDSNGRYIYVNDTICHALKYSRAELLSMSVYDVHVDMCTPAIWADFWQRLKQQGSIVFESQLRSRDGELITLEINANYLKLQGQELAWGFARDIEEQKKTQIVLRQSEQWLQLALWAGNIGIWDWNLKTNQIIWSENLFSLFGKTPDTFDVNYENFLNLIVHPEDRERLHQSVLRAIDQQVPHDIEFRFIAPDGTVGWSLCKGTVFYDQTGQPFQMIGVNMDITERKYAEVALRESEQRLQIALSASSTGIWDWNLKTNEVIWSESMFPLFDVNPYTHDGKLESFFNFVHPEDREFVEQSLTRAIDEQAICDIEFRVVWADGTVHWANGKGKVFYDETGQPVRMIGAHHDITDRKYAEIALRESEQRLQGIIDNCPAIIYLKDLQGQHILVNSEFERIMHLTREEVKNSTNAEIFSPNLAEALTRNDQKVLNSVTSWEFEEDIQLDDGLHTYLTIKFPLCDSVGQPYAICGISTDITERKQAEQKIREQAALIDIATDAIFVRDLEKRILFWSRGAENLYGWTTEESLGKKADELFCKGLSSQLAIGMQETIEEGSWRGELEQITKTGKKIIVASRWTLVRDEFGNPQSILVVNTDITEKKQLEQQFYRAQRLESLGTLASGIAHDLNNVFAPIMMIAQLLPSRCKNVDARTQELFKTLENSSQRGANLVKQILTFARGTEGKPILLQPGHLLKELVKVITQTFPKTIEIQTHIPSNTLWMVKADPTQLEQVLMNLAVNARDAMPNGGILTISAENRIIDETYARMYLDAHPGNYIVMTVSDTGIGIPPKLLEHIFEPFFTTKEIDQGTGLGLATVLGIVKNHGGFVQVSSQVGRGTQFQVYLPIGEGTLAESKIEGELPRGNGELILIVDDELIVQETTKETLENYNYKTLVANDGIEAIALYAQHQQEISVVLLDMLMPNMDGLTTIRTMKTLNPKVTIIATSGLPANRQQALFVGATAFLSKPYTARDLLTTFSHK
ncbi:PAS domain S-box protein [Nostoc sp. UHCC 0870]|uniref:PAS domain S-box protein n=1 Tax=Nostoc sp. UHCC 0870 TaxID=2914041 RepID=UPI001EDCB124|nr:PAS domain S-box protein [Nostoc sp. UHCC 0870]UKO97835.1 PAS domain S-box protein [Nostoc sp. UHCC 0870]